MKKNLLVIVASILVLTTFFPPSYTVFSEETENYCENMSFSLKTVRADDEFIEGQAEAAEEIQLEIGGFRETISVNDNGQIRLDIDEDILEIGEEIRLVNEQHEIETTVRESDAPTETLQSELVGECEIPEELKEERGDLEEDTEENSTEESSGEESREEASEAATAEEESTEESAEESPEQSSDEESREEDSEAATADEESTEESTEESPEQSSDEESREEDSEAETADEESTEESAVESQEQSSGEELREEDSEAEMVDEGPTEESAEESSEQSSDEESSATIETYQSPGLIDVDLLTNTTLGAVHRETSGGKHEIVLTYRGEGALQLGVLNNTYSNFYIPPEIMNEITEENLTATYDVPMIGIIFPIIRNDGTFDQDQINIEGNHVYMNFFNLLSLNLLSRSHYTFTLTIELDELPPTEDGEYVFHSVATNQLVDLSLISNDAASATLSAPGMVTFHNVPENISFETTSITPNSGTVRIPRLNPDWALQVRDTRRNENDIQITAEQEQPLTSSDGSHTLSDALVYVDENLESQPLSDGPLEVYSGTTGEGEISDINWDDNHGPMIEVDPLTVKEDAYDATIRWTIVNGP